MSLSTFRPSPLPIDLFTALAQILVAMCDSPLFPVSGCAVLSGRHPPLPSALKQCSSMLLPGFLHCSHCASRMTPYSGPKYSAGSPPSCCLPQLCLPKAGRAVDVTEQLLPFPYEFFASQGRLSLSDLQKAFLRVYAAVPLSVKCPHSDCGVTCSRKNSFLRAGSLPVLNSCSTSLNPTPQFIRQPEHKSYT